MGAGSSKVDWAKQKSQASASPATVRRNDHKHGIDDPYYPPPPVQSQISRSQSVKSPPASTPRRDHSEKKQSRHQRAYTDGGLGTARHPHWDPSYYPDHTPVIPQQVISQQQQQQQQQHQLLQQQLVKQVSPTQQPQQHPPLRNPLPPPPKDLFGGEFSRVHYASPPPFVPMPNDELKRSRTGKGKAKDSAMLAASLSQAARDIVLQRGEPSSSFSSHSSASTSNPPPQVVAATVANQFGVAYKPAMGQAHTQPSRSKSQSSASKHARGGSGSGGGFFSSLKHSFSSSSRPDNNDRPIIPPRPSVSSADGARAISSPYQLAPRGAAPVIPPFLFYWPEAPGYGFTTFSPHKILYKKRLYPTAEHLYQALKFIPTKSGRTGGDYELAERIRVCSNHPRDAVLEGRRLNKQARSDWKEMRTAWMDEIMYMKFAQHPDLRYELLSTHPADLVFASQHDDFWGVGPDHRGRNELGLSLARVRAKIVREMGK